MKSGENEVVIIHSLLFEFIFKGACTVNVHITIINARYEKSCRYPIFDIMSLQKAYK